ncbi:uracil-DNA glycosylase [Erythrobacteraceae bacterium CFH 75059]|uniref:uracil-DNA glycosylase n=1 Tax=Qipengyuania thermophila TaxID=2509361 RepID=UPI00101E98F8|nr:uracil-DNA glycosylase [Qipengyuania thermophila]TCD06538.1 uracil-DNA glycosylase [Erythrobacteraceae bacterium CFH 75059]
MNPDELEQGWRAAAGAVLRGPRLQALARRLADEEAAGVAVYPSPTCRLRALALTPFASVRVVILGQDPYHGPGQANGLAFAVPPGVRPPPSLQNILRERAEDLGGAASAPADLAAWARGGVLLLNRVLTVRAGQPASHAGLGWEALTDRCLEALACQGRPLVFMGWGAQAQAALAPLRARAGERHLWLFSPHPSPLSAHRGFFGSRPFSRANAFLTSHGEAPIDW